MKRPLPLTPADYDRARIVRRLDGFYWHAKDGGREYGPFATLLGAVQGVDYPENAVEPGESLEQAEADIGISDWIDPDTGEPAEEDWTRTEDH